MSTLRTGRPGANLAALRDHNAAVVLGLLRDAGERGASRAELAAGTGLTPQAVSKITARLRDAGLATAAGRRSSTGGKPATVLRLVPGAAYAVGLHVDRDALTATLVDLAGTVVATRTAPLAFGAGAEAVLDTAATEIHALWAEGRAVRGAETAPAASATGAGPATAARAAAMPAGGAAPVPAAGTGPRPAAGTGAAPGEPPAPATLLGVGVAAPGPLDHRRGVLHRVTGFPQWDGFPLRDALARRLGLAVLLDKDTNAAALGLLRGPRGAGRGADSFAYLHLGTGLGAGLVLGGAVHRGSRTGAGEFGHQVLQLDGPPCPCGRRGCVEVLCLRAAAGGDAPRAARLLGVAAANLVQLLDIDLVLLGGRTVLADPEPYLRGVRSELPPTVPVAVAPGGDRTVAEGAAALVLAPLFGRAGPAPDADEDARPDETTIGLPGGM
ncbi:ROK family transcriptional regulator [Streptomyces sp. SCA3-4]|nr:ROK family transcriptional regulator [Streptomyces sichuanensis]MCA6095585.1 ROK family transcriptional regulator [Streptomyces sichuanensis]